MSKVVWVMSLPAWTIQAYRYLKQLSFNSVSWTVPRNFRIQNGNCILPKLVWQISQSCNIKLIRWICAQSFNTPFNIYHADGVHILGNIRQVLSSRNQLCFGIRMWIHIIIHWASGLYICMQARMFFELTLASGFIPLKEACTANNLTKASASKTQIA